VPDFFTTLPYVPPAKYEPAPLPDLGPPETWPTPVPYVPPDSTIAPMVDYPLITVSKTT